MRPKAENLFQIAQPRFSRNLSVAGEAQERPVTQITVRGRPNKLLERIRIAAPFCAKQTRVVF